MSSAPLLQEHSLVWGQLSFAGPVTSDSLFDIEAVDGSHFGNPQPVIEVVRSLLIDGALAAVTGWENREVVIRLRTSASDGESASEAEAALFSQVLMDQPYPLEWTPPLDTGATTVFDVVVARIDRDVDEAWGDHEVLRGERFYVLTLTCLPFARAVESTIVPALPVPADPDIEDWTDVDTCGSTTGWTLETNGTSPSGPTLVTGPPTAITASAGIDAANDHLRLVRTGTIIVPDDYYLAVDVSTAGWIGGPLKARLDGVYVNPVAITLDGEDDSFRLFFDNVETINELAILKDFEHPGGGLPTSSITVYNIATTDTLGASSTTTSRQQSRLATVLGSAPTQAAIRLYDATTAPLGTDILVYTSRNAEFRPNLRRWIDTSVAPTSDATLVSGAYHSLATPTTFLIPAELLTIGTYSLLARMDVNVAGPLSWEARMATTGGATNVPGSEVITSGEVDLATSATFQVVDLAAMILPVVEVEGNNHALKLTLTGTADMLIDEAWLFNLDEGALTWVIDTETLHWLEVRSPELGAARPSAWGGRNAVGNGGVCVDWKCESFGSHRFEPGIIQVFTVCATSKVSQAEIESFPRFHSHVWGGETS